MFLGCGAGVSFGSGLFLLSGVLAITGDALANYYMENLSDSQE